MAITLRTAGTWAAVTASAAVTLPTHQEGDMLLVRVTWKSDVAASASATTATAGWTKIGQGSNGTTNSSNGGGSVFTAAFFKVAESSSETNPTISFVDCNPAAMVAMAYQKAAGEMWVTPTGNSGPDTTSGTGHSATIATHIRTYSGDLVDFFTGIADDTTMTVPTFTQTGATLNTVTESPATALSSTSGFDIAADGGYRTLTSGTSTAAAVVTGTTSTSETGTSWMTRLRVTAPPVAQAQALIKAIGINNHAQAMAYIFPQPVTRRGHAQALAAITYGITNVVDTFTRTVSNGMGTANTGGTYALQSGTVGQVDVDGSKLTFTSTGSTSVRFSLDTVYTGGSSAYEAKATFKVTSFGSTVGSSQLTLKTERSNFGDNGIGARLNINNSTAAISLTNTIDTNSSTSSNLAVYTLNDTWNFVFRVIRIKTGSTSRVKIQSKTWRQGDSEPGWLHTYENTSLPWLGIPTIEFGAGNSTNNFEVDNYYVTPIGWSESGQAKAYIHGCLEEEILNDVPLLYYKLGEPTGNLEDLGTIGKDDLNPSISGRGATGLIHATQDDGAILFNGTSDSIYFGSTPTALGVPMGAAERTLEAWVKTTSATRQILWHWGESGTSNEWMSTGIEANGQAHWNQWGGDLSFGSVGQLSDGNSHHLVFTYDGATTLRCYIDGVEAANSPQTITALNTQDGNMWFGTDGNDEFNGTADEIAVYGQALPAGVIRIHYIAGINGCAGAITPPQKFAQAMALIAVDTDCFYQEVMSRGPISYWRLGEASGSTTLDENTSNPLTYVGSVTQGVTSILGDMNTAVTFPSSSATAYLASAADLPIGASDRTISFLFKSTSTVDYNTVVWWGDLDNANEGWSVFLTTVGGEERIFITTNATTDTNFTPPLGTTLTDGEWHHVVLVLDGTDLWCYIDGSSDMDSSNPVTITAPNTSGSGEGVGIGGRGASGTDPFNGTLDEVVIWDYALDSLDVQALYSSIAVETCSVKYPIHVCGAECGIIGAGASATGANADHWDFGQNVTVSTSVFANGQRSYRLDPTGVAAAYLRKAYTTTSNIAVGQAKIYIEAWPTDTQEVIYANVASGSAAAIQVDTVSHELEIQIGGDVNAVVRPGAISLNTWYTIDYFFYSGTNGFARMRVDGEATIYESTTNQTATTFSTGQRIGTASPDDTFVMYADDIIMSETASDFPFDLQNVGYLYPDSSGAHSFTAGDFKDTGGTNITSPSGTVHTLIDDAAAGTSTGITTITDYIQQAVVRTNGYVNFGFSAMVSGATPLYVNVVSAHHASTTGSNDSSLDWGDGDGATSAEIYRNADFSQLTVAYDARVFTSSPVLGPWTESTLNAAKIRWGYAGDVLGIPYLDNVILEYTYTGGTSATTYRVHGQAQARIKNTYYGLGQSQAQIKQTYRSHAQAQAQIKQTYRGHAQANAWIENTYRSHAQAQAWIENTYRAHAQAQAQIKQTYRAHAQAQADIKQTYRVHAQAQGDIKQTYYGLGQAQARIKNTYFGLGQAQANIKQTYYAVAQAQADIKQTYRVYAQAQAEIVIALATYTVVVQAQAWIENTYRSHGQAQAYIELERYVVGQAQARIRNTYSVVGQAQAQIKQTYRQHAQAQAQVKQTYRVHAQSQAWIENTYTVVGQAQARIKNTYFAVGQSQAQIKQTYYAVAQAMATIQGQEHGQAQAQIKQTYYAVGQAQADIKQTYRSHAQANAWIEQTSIAHGQAQARIKSTYFAHGQAQGSIKQTYRIHAQAQADIKQTYFAHGQATVWIKNSYYGLGQAQASIENVYNAHGQAQALIKQVYRVHAQAQADIKQTYIAHAQAQARIKNTYYGLGQAQARIKQTYYAHAQAMACIKGNAFGQAQAWIKNSYFAHGQSQARIKNTYNGLGQAQANIEQVYYAHGQAQADIKATSVVHGQAQAQIKQSYVVHGQAQAWIEQTYYQHGQAQALIKQVYYAHAQATVWIEQSYYGLGQAQADIKQTYYQHGQAQADIKQTYVQHGQAQSQIKQTYRAHAQAQAAISNTYFVHAQAQAKINAYAVQAYAQAMANIRFDGNARSGQAQARILAFGYPQWGQAQADIKATYRIHAQAQADIKQTYNVHAQAAAWVENTYYGLGQAQARIKNTYYSHAQANAYIIRVNQNVHGQAQALIKNTYFGSAQAQAKINAFGINQHGQSQAYIKTTDVEAFGQAQADIKAVGYSHGQAQGWIETTYNQHGQAQADIKQTYRSYAQANAWIEQISYAHAQAQATIENTYNQHGQAQGQIKQTYRQHGQAAAWIRNTYYGVAQAQAKINAYGVVQHGQAQAYIIAGKVSVGQAQGYIKAIGINSHGQAQGWIETTTSSHGQSQADIKQTYRVYAQANALISKTSFVHGQAQGWIENTYVQHGQAQGSIKQTYRQHGQTQARIKNTYVAHGQANALIGTRANQYAQAQATIRATYYQHGQANADIKQTYRAYAQAAGLIKDTYEVHGQAQAYITLLRVGYGQAQATIENTYSQHAQAQALIRNTYNAHANAQGVIKVSVNVHGQAQGWIETVTRQHAQAEALITSGTAGYGQAQAQIKQVYIVTGQAQADISKSAGYGQAQALIIVVNFFGTMSIDDEILISLALDDEALPDDGLEDTGQPQLLMSDSGLTLDLEDSGIKLLLSDINY